MLNKELQMLVYRKGHKSVTEEGSQCEMSSIHVLQRCCLPSVTPVLCGLTCFMLLAGKPAECTTLELMKSQLSGFSKHSGEIVPTGHTNTSVLLPIAGKSVPQLTMDKEALEFPQCRLRPTDQKTDDQF